LLNAPGFEMCRASLIYGNWVEYLNMSWKMSLGMLS
jgi:hypothetical protein